MGCIALGAMSLVACGTSADRVPTPTRSEPEPARTFEWSPPARGAHVTGSMRGQLAGVFAQPPIAFTARLAVTEVGEERELRWSNHRATEGREETTIVLRGADYVVDGAGRLLRSDWESLRSRLGAEVSAEETSRVLAVGEVQQRIRWHVASLSGLTLARQRLGERIEERVAIPARGLGVGSIELSVAYVPGEGDVVEVETEHDATAIADATTGRPVPGGGSLVTQGRYRVRTVGTTRVPRELQGTETSTMSTTLFDRPARIPAGELEIHITYEWR